MMKEQKLKQNQKENKQEIYEGKREFFRVLIYHE